jgi:hypothetical protein
MQYIISEAEYQQWQNINQQYINLINKVEKLVEENIELKKKVESKVQEPK